MNYDFKRVERKWQQEWQKNPPAKAKPAGNGKKYYCLDMFPYPSGSGLHVGHWRGYVLSDIYARMKWLEGYNVLHPMGWDAFGLPAENDAIKKGIHPKTGTQSNIAHFKEQLHALAAIYDWDKELSTIDPDYYKWTQWIFLQMYKADLAYQANMPINWCPSCLTGLANEEVVQGACERCGTLVEQRNIRQWVLKITAYAEKLLEGLDRLAWSEKVKLMQANWIGKSEGARIDFKTTSVVDGAEIMLPIYTTCPETIFGVTFIAIASNHALADTIITQEQKQVVAIYRAANDNHIFADDVKEVRGVFTGSYARNPINGDKVPVYIANYVLADYGTGMIMGVPAHCDIDFQFAVHYQLPLVQVIAASDVALDAQGNVRAPYLGDGLLINSGSFNDLSVHYDGKWRASEAKEAVISYLESHGLGERKVTYKLRDWIFSRQRYWGEPIPLIHCPRCGVVPVPEDQLPVALPEVDNYQPTGTGESPLAAIDWWVNTECPCCQSPAKRETNTMPQWAGSCWYFLRYPNPHLNGKAWDAQDMSYWLPVDLYVGGIEHAILHLLYARFYVKVLYDLNLLPFDEPFKHLFNQGMVLKYSEKSGLVEKMSKSKGNVVNPDEIVAQYGSDVLRMYMMFMGPPELDCEWQDTGLEGIKRFANRLAVFLENEANWLNAGESEDLAVTKRVHTFVKEYQERLAAFKPNTAIAAAMELVNDLYAYKMKLSADSAEKIIVSLSVLAPHLTSELLESRLHKKLESCAWPTYDASLTVEHEVTIPVQVNGKMRATLTIARGASEEVVSNAARKEIAKWLPENAQIMKVIFVADRMINFVIK